MRISQVGDFRCALGEGPVWDVIDQALYFVDVLGHRVHRLSGDHADLRTWEMGGVVTALTPRETGGLLVVTAAGTGVFDPTSGDFRVIAERLSQHARVNVNDGKVDRQGRFVVGTLEPLGQPNQMPSAGFYRLEAAGPPTLLDDGYRLTNEPCWSPDGATFYIADSLDYQIYAYDYDVDAGLVSGKRPFVSTRDFGGIPDGATVDADGRLWTALCEGGAVVAFDNKGFVDRVIELPTPLIASVMFGGAELDRLYVTTMNGASFGRADDGIGGSLFVIDDLGAVGLAERRVAL